jgi:hypothetical protein
VLIKELLLVADAAEKGRATSFLLALVIYEAMPCGLWSEMKWWEKKSGTKLFDKYSHAFECWLKFKFVIIVN